MGWAKRQILPVIGRTYMDQLGGDESSAELLSKAARWVYVSFTHKQ